jgi:hypothetical protein
VDFLKKDIIPLVKKYGVYFDIHNSACSAASNPYDIRNYLKSIGNKLASKVHFHGNQAISAGGWDPLLPQKTNFWSSVNGNSLEVDFPKCKEFESKGCVKMFQDEEVGICFDDKKNQYAMLGCMEIKRNSSQSSINNKYGASKKTTSTRQEWTRFSLDLQVVVKENESYERTLLGLEMNTDHDFEVDENDKDEIEEARKNILSVLNLERGKPSPKIIIKSELVQRPSMGSVIDHSGAIESKVYFGENSAEKAEDYRTKILSDLRYYLIDLAAQY